MYTLKPSYTSNGKTFCGTVDIIIGSRLLNSRLIRMPRMDKDKALTDATKLARLMIVMGVNCPINLRDYE